MARITQRDDHATPPPTRWWPVVLVGTIVVALIALALGKLPHPWQSEPKREATNPFETKLEEQDAFADAPWAKDLSLDLLDAWRNLEFNAASGGWRVRDTTSPYVNVKDGERRSTRPDPDLGPPLSVWLFGGSAAFGAGQRDDHTIASELVRRAGKDGVALEVHNLAVPASVDWQSVVLLIERLAWDEPPDLVVFYDGANDIALQGVLASRGRATEDRPASLVDAQVDEAIRAKAKETGADDILPEPDRSEPDAATSPEEAGRIVLARYGRGVEVARRAAEDAGVPIAFFWQPDLRAKRPPSSADRETLEAAGMSGDQTAWATTSDAVRAGLDDRGVTDLSTVFDRRSEALFWDAVHTNEAGARVVADALYRSLEPQLDALRTGS